MAVSTIERRLEIYNEARRQRCDLAASVYDPTGLVAGHCILNDDTFERGMQGWTQLFTPLGVNGAGWGGPISPIGTLNRVTRATPRLHLRTPNVPSASAMGIKRLGRIAGDGRHLLEFWGCLELVNLDITRPRFFIWALDYELANQSRRFAEIQWFNFNETTNKRAGTFRFHAADGTYIDIPTPPDVDPLINTNENKASPIYYLAFEIDTRTGYLRGFRFNDQIMLGSLARNPSFAGTAAFMATYGQAFDDTDLPAFIGGLNPLFSVVNRTNAAASSGVSELVRQRTTLLDAPGTGVPIFPSTLAPSEELNWLLSNYPVSQGAITTAEWVGEPGAIYDVNVLLDSVNNAPTAGTLNLKFQAAPLAFHGYSMGSEVSADLRPWVDVLPNDNNMGHLLVDGGWPAPTIAYNDAMGKQVVRSIRCAPNGRLMRAVLTPAGITPANANVKVTVNVTRRMAA